MISLCILSIIYGIISTIRIKNKCKKLNIEFNPYKGTFVDYIGFLVGCTAISIGIIAIFWFYLP